MSWGQHYGGPGNPGPDPYGRASASDEPHGFVSHDPYAPPGYNYPSDHTSQGWAPGYHGPTYAPYGYQRPPFYHYDAAHPPRPAVEFFDAIRLFFKNYAVFHGRASRSEFWWVYLGGALLTILLVIPVLAVAAVTGPAADPPVALGFYVLAVLLLGLGLVVPSISLQVRRLHDAGFSGFFSIFAYVPYLNYITFLVPLIMSMLASKPEGVKYDNPDGSQPVTVLSLPAVPHSLR